MTQPFIRVAIPVLYVYDKDTVPEEPPGFDMGLLPVVSRVLKDHAGTGQVTVITGAPAPADELETAFTHLALQYAHLKKASPEAGNLIVAEFIADNFDPESVLDHLQRIVEERQRTIAEEVESLTSRSGQARPDGEDADDAGGDDRDAAAAAGGDADEASEAAGDDEAADDGGPDDEAGPKDAGDETKAS